MSLLDDVFLPLALAAVNAGHPAAGMRLVVVGDVELLLPTEEDNGTDC